MESKSEREAKAEATSYSGTDILSPSGVEMYGVAWWADRKFQSVSAKDNSGFVQRSGGCTKVSKESKGCVGGAAVGIHGSGEGNVKECC